MEICNDSNNSFLDEISNLINENKMDLAKRKLDSISNKTAMWNYLYGLMLFNKAWYDSAIPYFKNAIDMDPTNNLYNDAYITLMSRHKHYSDDYYHSGYRRRHRGCSCCCCDDCCCDFDISCCDLICLDQCCECMGGDLIDCI